MLLGILLTIHILVCIALICVVLLQRSEGGALGMGGGPSGIMSARGAGDVLTRATWILFSLFLGLSLVLTVLGAKQSHQTSVTDRLKVERLDPSKLGQPAVPAPVTPAPTTSDNSPIQAPLPGLPVAPSTSSPVTSGLDIGGAQPPTQTQTQTPNQR
jgi:preprotein translocase subunit SecG